MSANLTPALKVACRVPMQWRKSVLTGRRNVSKLGLLSARAEQHKLLSMVSQRGERLHGTFGASIFRNRRTHIHQYGTRPRRRPTMQAQEYIIKDATVKQGKAYVSRHKSTTPRRCSSALPPLHLDARRRHSTLRTLPSLHWQYIAEKKKSRPNASLRLQDREK